MKNSISVTNVSKSYGMNYSKQQVLKEIDLDISGGTFVVIHGESGSGKSTLINLIAGFDSPDSGEILVNETNIAAMNETKKALFRRKQMGIVFQQYHLVPELTAFENVIFPLTLNGIKGKAAREKAREILEFVGMPDNLNKLPEEYSGGQCQRIAIARAMVIHPGILLADEPTGNLDSQNRELVLDLISKINRKLGATILMVTHSVSERKYADTVIEIKDGLIKV